ncbi:kinase-like domain-containing protein [Mycena sanguinolenta]|nr:kinase-like domain-containing protein [Mycena sanguinolenta]
MFNEGYYRPATASSSISSDSNSHLETREQDLISNQLLIYPAAIAYLKKVSSRGIPGWTPSEVSKLLESHLHSMTAVDPVSGIVRSLECRKTLLQVCSKLGLANDPNLRATLRKDGTRIAALLVSIFTSQSLEEIALRLEGDPAQCFLDVVQSTLDKGLLRVDEHCRMARRMIRKLCASGDMLPSALFITGIIGKEQHPTFGGAYGDIYRASYDDQIVALKYMRAVQFMRGSDLREIRRKFCREALLWKSLHHPHILPFLGIDQDTFPLSLVTVSPWMEHGTIMSYLKKHGHENVDKFLYEIAQGLQYLHSCGIVHGDLRGTNILINEHWSACLADFGLSILSDATATMSTNRGGSLYWMAPELLAPDRFGTEFTRTPASDVFAFGCVCFELYTGRPPFGDLPEPAALIKVVTGKRQERFSSPPAISDFLWQHVTACWDQNPTVRPVTETVVRSMVWPASVTPVLPSSGIPMPTAVPSRVEQAVDAPFSVPSVISSSPNNLEMHLESNSRRTTSSETLSVRSGASSSSSLSTPFHKRFRQPPPPEGHPLIPELHAMPRNLFPRIIRRGPVSVRGNGIFGRWFWSNKWMTLMERFLTVHKSEETPQQYFILLERITKIEQSSLKPYCLALETQDRKRHFFSFRNDQEMHGWKHDLSPPKPEAVARYDEKARLSENEQNEQASLAASRQRLSICPSP